MATNKRKDAAALFELIDKSTLKVPKNSKALKIPSWWSSKTNPPTDAGAMPADVPGAPAKPAPSAAPQARTVPVTPPSRSAANSNGVSNGTGGATPAPAASRPTTPERPAPATPLFPNEQAGGLSEMPADDPVMASVMAPESPLPETTRPAPSPAAPIAPSIRPPAKPAPISSPVASSPRSAGTSAAAPRGKGGSGVIAPATVAPSGRARGGWLSDQAQAVLSLSPTVLVAGVCTVIMVVALVAYMVYGGRRTSSTTTAPVIPSQTQIAQPAQETPKSENRLIQSGDSGPAVTPLAQDVAGKVYDGTEVQWNKDLYYIVIAATPRMDVTRKNADFLAQHGVSVVISKTNRGMFALISYQGFSTNKDAEVLRKRIVDLGKIHPDAKKTAGKGVWYDAYVWQFRPKG